MDIDGWAQTVFLSYSSSPLEGDEVIILVTERDGDQLQQGAGLRNPEREHWMPPGLLHMPSGSLVVIGLIKASQQSAQSELNE